MATHDEITKWRKQSQSTASTTPSQQTTKGTGSSSDDWITSMRKQSQSKKDSGLSGVSIDFINSYLNDVFNYQQKANARLSKMDYSTAQSFYDINNTELENLRKRHDELDEYFKTSGNTLGIADYDGLLADLQSIRDMYDEVQTAYDEAKTAHGEWSPNALGISAGAFNAINSAYDLQKSITASGGTSEDWYSEVLRQNEEAKAAAEAASKAYEQLRARYTTGTRREQGYAGEPAELAEGRKAFEAAQQNLAYSNYVLSLAERQRYDSIDDGKEGLNASFAGRKAFNAWLDEQEHAPKENNSFGNAVAAGLGAYTSENAVIDALKEDQSYWQPTENWTEDEERQFYVLYNRNPAEARAYGERVNNDYADKKRSDMQENRNQWETKNIFTGAAATVGALVGHATALGDFYTNALEYAARGTVTHKDYLTPSDYGNIWTGNIADELNSRDNKVNRTLSKLEPVFGEVGVGDVYTAAYNALQSLTYGAMGGGVGAGVIYFGIGAKNGFENAVSRGATPEQAFTVGILDGTIEQLTETYSIDKLVNMRTPSSLKQLLVNAMVQGGIEANEETLSTILSTISDEFIMGDKSALNTNIQELVLQGMSYEDAQKQATKDWLKEVAYSAASGYLSGAMGAGVQSGVHSLSRYKGDANSLIEKGMNTPEGSRPRSMAEKLARKVEKESGDVRINNLQAQRLTELIAQEEAKSRLNAQGVEADKDTLDAIGHALSTTNELSRREKAILRDEKVGDVATQMRASEILGREWDYDNQKDKDPVIKSNYDVSENGKTIDTTTGEEVTIEKIDSLSKGKMTLKLSNGKVVSSDSVSYGSNGEALIYETVASLDTLPVIANELVRGYDPESGVSPEVYARGIQEAFVYGQYNLPESEMLAEGTFSADLTAEQRQLAYKSGQKFSGMAIAKQQAEIKKGKAVARVGAVANQTHINDFNPSAFDISTEQGQRQRASYNVAKMMSEVLGVDIYVFESYVKDNKRVYIDEKGNEVEAPNGYYKNGAIHIDLNAGNNGEGTILFTLSHELTHFIREWSPAKFKVLANFLNEQYGKKGISIDVLVRQQMKKARDAGRTLTYDEAYEEFVADSMETMLTDGKVAEKLALLKQQDKNLWQKIRDFISDIYAKVVKAYEGMNPNSTEGKYVSEMVDALENLQQLFAEGLAEASVNYQGSFTPGKVGTVFNAEGQPVAHSTEDGSVQLSMRTYEEDGREAFRKYLTKCVSSNRLTQAEMDEMINGIEEIYNVCKEFKDKYAPFGTWSEAAVVRDTYGKPVFSVVTPNGEYKMNLDFSLVCKKRRTLDAVFNEMSKRGIIDDFELGQKSVVKINELIREHGFETACALCFVDAKRFRQAAMVDQFVGLYNELVESLVPESKRDSINKFNFSGYSNKKPVADSIDTWEDSKLDFSHLNHVLATYGKGTVEWKSANYIKNNPAGRKLLLRGDFMSSGGFDAVKTQNPQIMKLYNSKKGTGGPKAAFGDVQYMNEIIKKSRGWTPAKAYSVGGVRIQSFSDYVPRMVFDYVQMIYDLAATKLPAHAYTKEALFVKQFGLTGIKINMSLIPAIAEGGIAPGLDANGNYVWAGESFDYETAKEIQSAEGYTENCGTICVGVSKEHITKLLGDPNIRMVIPYHKSGLNPVVAHMNKIAAFTDYTSLATNPGGCQSTCDKNGSKLAKDFNFNAALKKTGDPKAVVREYLDWCSKNEYTPRFAEFAWHENYYKLIEDFTLYDKDGKYVPQREVRAVFPTKDSAFGSMKDLIESGLEEDAIIEGKRERGLSAIVDEIEKSLPRTEAEIEEVEVKQADRDLEAGVKYQNRSDSNLENEPSPVFYSQMAKVVDSVKQEKFGASSVVNMLKGKGVKNEEIKWSGIETWLEGKKSVTKAELLEFIQSSMLQIDEETLTNEEIPYTQKQLNQIAKFEAERDTIAENLKAEWKRLIGTEIPITHFGAGLESAVVNNLLEANATKKNDTEAGRNYKTAKDDLKKCIEYSDDYFGYENAKQAFMAAVRNPSEFMTGSELSDLEKSVFQNFIKAKEAFKKVDGIPVQDQRALIAIAASADKFSKKISEVKSEHYAENAKHMTKWGQYKLDGGKNYRELLFKMPDFNYSNNAMYGHWGDRMGVLAHARIQDFNTDVGKMLFVEEIQSDWHNEGHKTGYESVPDAPFRDNYHEYVLKRLIREAAEKGYNSIGWTTAAIQSDRWSDEYAEGYRIEYDQDIPKFLNKYGKKWGTKVEKTILKNGTEVWHMAITDSMQKSVLTEGQPLYQTRGNANLEKVNAVLEKQNAKLREDVKELKELLKLQKSVTNGTKLTPSSVEAVSKKLMRDIHSKGEVSELKALLNAFYSEVRNNESTSLDDYKELAQPVVDWLHDHMVTEETKQDASAFAYESDLIEQDIFSQVLSSYWDVSTLHTVADVKQKQINELKAKHNARTAELKNIKREVAALKEAHKEEVARIRTEAREERLAAEREIIRKYQESRKNSVESRAKTAEKAKIRKKISAINKLLNRGTKERNVKEGLQEVAAQALKTADILFTEAYSDNDMIRDGIQTPMTADEQRYMAEAKSLLERISKLPIGTDERNNLEGQLSYRKGKLKDVLFRERARLYDADVSMALDELAEAYDKIKDSPYSYIAEAYDEEVANMLKTMNKEIGGKKIRDMTLENLELVNDAYTMVLTTIRNANKSFANSKDISEMGDAVVNEVRKVGGHKKMRGVISNAISQFGWNNMKPVYAFKAIGSDTLSKLFDNVRAGEDTWARDVYDARSFFRAQAAKTGYDKWDMAKSYTFTSTSGLEFSLTLEQMMSLYAFSKREQALDHLRKGGIVFDENTEVNVKGKLGIKQKFNPSDATAYNISAETLAEITGKLSKQQIAFVDAMQDYLSTTMGEKGNEVSMALYGVKLFKEKFYFPLRSATQYQERAKEAGKRERKVKNSGFTKPTTPKAGNPIVLAPFMDVWSQHVNDMSMYHAFVLPMEDFYKVYNYKTAAEEDTAIESVNAAIQNAYGKGAINYIDTLLKDLNGGARTDTTAGFINKAMGLFKKGAVFASASVVIQQPSAIARAFAMVDSKYFVGKSLDSKKHKALWEEVKKYAPVAMIKEMGHFDTNMGKSTEDFIKAKEYGSWEEKFKGIVTDGGYRDDVLSKAPALADELAWCKIWNAVKLETADKHKNLKVGSEEFLQAAGKRFTEVIVNTQVYDSVLSRSANMRSKDTGMKMATAFLAEPTTAINMVTDALIQGKRGNAKNARRIIGSVIGAQILNSALVSLVYAARDDDDDETYWEKYLASFLAETKDSLNPATYIPFLKDIVSLVQGYEVERSDMAVISDIVRAYEQLGSDKISGWRKVENFAGGIAQLFGLPVKNIMRDARALWQVVDNAFNGESYTAAGAKYAAKEALTGEATSNGEQLLNALIEGDKAHEERVRARFKDESAATSAIRSAIKAGFESGEFDEQTATDLLMQHTGLDENDAYWKMREWTSEEDDFSRYGAAYDAMLKGESIDAAVEELTSHGYTEKKVYGQLKSQIGAWYRDGEITKEQAENMLLKYADVGANEAGEIITKWSAEAETGIAYDDVKQEFLDGKITADEAIKMRMEYGGYDKEEAEKTLADWNFEKKYGFAYSDRASLLADGKVSRDTLINAIMEYKELDRAKATAAVDYLEFQIEYPQYEKLSQTRYESYFVGLDDVNGKSPYSAGIDIGVYAEYYISIADIKGDDADGDGKTDRDSKKSKILAVINSLPLSNAQKDILYLQQYARSGIRNAPWH